MVKDVVESGQDYRGIVMFSGIDSSKNWISAEPVNKGWLFSTYVRTSNAMTLPTETSIGVFLSNTHLVIASFPFFVVFFRFIINVLAKIL